MIPTWLLSEELDVLVLADVDSFGEGDDDFTALLVCRVSKADSVVLSVDALGDYSVNGVYVNFGDDAPVIWGLFDEVREQVNPVEDLPRAMTVGSHARLLPNPD
jgi:hypothetical protein